MTDNKPHAIMPSFEEFYNWFIFELAKSELDDRHGERNGAQDIYNFFAKRIGK